MILYYYKYLIVSSIILFSCSSTKIRTEATPIVSTVEEQNIADKKIKFLVDNGILNEIHYNLNDSVTRKLIFYKNGRLHRDIGYIGAIEFGRWTIYYENGQLQSEGNYPYCANSDTVSLKSRMVNTISGIEGFELYYQEKNGIWKYFSKNGGLDRIEHWDNGVLLRTDY